MNCVFCSIVKGDIPSDKVFENENVLAFRDIHPAAPVHILVIPKKHIESAVAITNEDTELLAEIFKAIRIIAKEQGLDNGFRLVSNIGTDGGQSVKHLHFHMLGGKEFGESFG